MIRMLWGVLLCAVLAQNAQAQNAQSQAPRERTVAAASGALTQLAYHAVLRSDCTTGPLPKIIIEEMPRHGAVSLAEQTVTTAPTFRCPNQKLQAIFLMYRANQRFVGQDKIVYRIETGGRRSEPHTIAIDIKAQRPGAAPNRDTKVIEL